MNKFTNPHDIEVRSFEIISEYLKDEVLDPSEAPVIKRVIHTTADFDYVKNLKFSDNVVNHAISVLKTGACIITDTNMTKAGINKSVLAKSSGEIYCFMSDEDVMKKSKETGQTRASVAIDKASLIKDKPLIFVVGNAPTALIRLYENIKNGLVAPKLIIAVPVGFVNVEESKSLILELKNIPYIVSVGKKGGSNVAAAIVNALLYTAFPRDL